MESADLLKQLSQAGLDAPRMLTIAITADCNLFCRHCWVSAGEAAADSNVSLGALRRCVQEFYDLGGRGVRITGGEPLCHPGWLELLQYCCSRGFDGVALQTNAMLLNDEHVAVLSELDFPGLALEISLDGATPASHDLVRGAGAFDVAMVGIEGLVQAGLGRNISLRCTEMRHNLAEIPDLLALADRLGVGSVVSGAMVGCGRATASSVIAPPGPDQYLELLSRFDSDSGFRGLYRKIGTVAALEWHSGDRIRSGCCTFIENPYLTPAGRLYPCLLCHVDHYSVSRVFEKGLVAAIAEGIPLWAALLRISRQRSAELTHCRDCPGKLCCAGGCMGRAWGSCGDLLAPDDRCQARRAIYQLSARPFTSRNR